jgi:Family of unknown function (DUF5984)
VTQPVCSDPGLRFRFQLTPLPRVPPWGQPERRLHWFALTDGWYWIETGGQELLRYSPETLLRQRDGGDPQHPYVDYYVARLWEDLIELTSTIMRPVPHDLVEFVASNPDDWISSDSEESWAAAVWHGEHALDLGYLRQAPHIRAWRTAPNNGDEVTVTWRHQLDDETRFAADPAGRVQIPVESFVAAVRRLDGELMTAMDQRITELERTGPPADIEIDIEQLRSEHVDRATWLAQRLASQPDMNWSAVRLGAGQLLRR